MLAPAMVQHIEDLLARRELSQRQIAAATGVSRAAIGVIAAGKRPKYSPRPAADRDQLDEPPGPLARCPGCGGRVYLPCRLCRIRKLKELELAARVRSQQARRMTRHAPSRPVRTGKPPERKVG